MSKEKNKVMGGLLWVFSERISREAVSFILQIILARLLMPEDYGVIAMISIFMVIANTFVTTGFSTSLVQKKDADDLDYSTMFHCSSAVSILLYVILFISAPYIADFYNMPLLTSVTRVYGVSLLLSPYDSIQRAYVSRNMMFRKFFYTTMAGTILSGIVGVIMAYIGYGVWSIVGQHLANSLINMLVLSRIIDWRPKCIFSLERAKSLMSYGSNVLGASLLGRFFNELRQLLIGKFFSASDLAFFNRGRSFPTLVSNNIESTIEQVLFPAMSNHSDKPHEIKAMMRRSISVSSYIMYYFMTLLAVASKPFIIILLTEKWAPAIPYMQMICISNMIAIMSTANMQAIKAIGRSDIVFKLEFWKKPIFLLILWWAVHQSVWAVAMTMPIYSVYAAIINMWPNRKLLDYGILEQVRDQLPAVLLASMAALLAIPILRLPIENELLVMFIQIVVCTLSYWLGSVIFHVSTYYYLLATVKDFYKTKIKG